MADYFLNNGIDFTVAANKCDKLKKSEFEARKSDIEKAFAGRDVVMYSAESGFGRQNLKDMIDKKIDNI
jgi:GTP-binding protein EngB required for normal cell division